MNSDTILRNQRGNTANQRDQKYAANGFQAAANNADNHKRQQDIKQRELQNNGSA